MCGIAGFIGTGRIDEKRVDDCLARMHRRGPDHAEARQFRTPAGGSAWLLSARLKIIDLDDRSNQPMTVEGRTITYNGELYNYLELRRELEADGRQFSTTSDTEVLLQAIEHWGWDALDRCEGMWALAVYDERDGSLRLARDRFGEKPLFTYRDSSGLYFGSEPKCITALLGHRLSVNGDQVRRYLVHGYKALNKTSATFFDGLVQLPSATTLHLDACGEEIERHRYWALGYCPEAHMTADDAVAGVRERLTRSVELRLRADVPLAFCLSGGVDSNALAAIASRVCGYDVHGFTIVNDDSRYDERDVVQPSVAELGIRHTSVPLERDGFLGLLGDAVKYHDAPVATIAYFVHGRLMAAIAADGYRISVSGTAADELLTGYYDHHLAYLAELASGEGDDVAAREAWARRVSPYVRNPYLRDPDLFVNDPNFRGHIYFETQTFAAYLREEWDEPFTEEHFTGSLLRNRMLNELFHENVPVLLHEDDLNAMYYSIENRSPFLDRRLAEFCYRIPTRLLIRDGFAKAILREAVRGIAPDVVVDNPRKVGFNAPISSLLNTQDPKVRTMLLADSPIYGLVRRESIETLIDRRDLPNSLSKFLFSFVSAKLFLETFGG
jgi:asparagine synthase (glutamine-hydrolysing)